MTLPLQSHPFNAGGPVDPVWLAWLRTLEQGAATNNADLAAQISAIATALGSPDGTVGNIPPNSSQTHIANGTGISVTGNPTDGYLVSLLPVTAESVSYDNTTSGLTAEDVQAAIDELKTLTGAGAPCFVYTTDTGSTADSDPGSGLMKWNNATQSSATKLFFDDATANTGTDLSALFTELAGSSTAGIIHMVAGNGAFQVYKWTGIADGTGYFKFTVTPLCSSGSFADNITVRVAFLPMPPSSGGGGGSIAWTLLNSWDFAVSGAVASIEASLAGYNEVKVDVQDVTLAASGYRAVQVSSNGGTSYPTSYDYISFAGVRTTNAAAFMQVHNTVNAGARSGIAQFQLVAASESLFNGSQALNGNIFLLPAFGTKPNRVKVGGWTSAGATTNMTGGKVFIYAR